MDAVEIGGDCRGMSVVTETYGWNNVEINKDGWCLYNALLEGFDRVPSESDDPELRLTYARQLAYIIGQIMKKEYANLPYDDIERIHIETALRGNIVYRDGTMASGRDPEFGLLTEEAETDPLKNCIMKGDQCRKYIDISNINTFFDSLSDILPGSIKDAKIWGDYVALNIAIRTVFQHIANKANYSINIHVATTNTSFEGIVRNMPIIEVSPTNSAAAKAYPSMSIELVYDGKHFNVRIKKDGAIDIDPIEALEDLLQTEEQKRKLNSIMPSTVGNTSPPAVVSIPGISVSPDTTRGVSIPAEGGERSDDLLVKAAQTLKSGAQQLLDLSIQPLSIKMPIMSQQRVRFVGHTHGVARDAVAKPQLPPPTIAMRAPIRRRLPLTQPARPISSPNMAGTVFVEEVSGGAQPAWAPAQMDMGLRKKCESAPVVTDECVQFDLDKDIDAVHSFIERHQIRNSDPRMRDYIKDSTSGDFSHVDLAAKYPDHTVYVRNEGGRPVMMKVTNPYRAKSYRYPTDNSVSFADPMGTGLSDADKPLHKQNVDLLKAIAPASVIADKRFATAILESLWRCSASQDLAGKPACFPARVLGEMRLFEKYKDQASRKQLADHMKVFSEWGMVSDIMRQMIHGDVPPVRPDAPQVKTIPEPAVDVEPIVAISGEQVTVEEQSVVAVAAPAEKPPVVPQIRPIRRGLATRAPTQIGALGLGPRFQYGILPPTVIGTASMVT